MSDSGQETDLDYHRSVVQFGSTGTPAALESVLRRLDAERSLVARLNDRFEAWAQHLAHQAAAPRTSRRAHQRLMIQRQMVLRCLAAINQTAEAEAP